MNEFHKIVNVWIYALNLHLIALVSIVSSCLECIDCSISLVEKPNLSLEEE